MTKQRAKRDTSASPWQTVLELSVIDHAALGIRRLAVPGGWLYQVARDIEQVDGEHLVDWHPAVFVPGIGSSDGDGAV